MLSTPRLVLSPLVSDDLESLREISNRLEVGRYLWDGEPVTERTARDYLARSMRDSAAMGIGLFGVRTSKDEPLIGFCGLCNFQSSGGVIEAELVYGLLPGWWGRGLATEAARECLRFAFEQAGISRVLATVDAPNTASRRVLERLGMEFVERATSEEPQVLCYSLGRARLDRAGSSIPEAG